MILKVGDKVTCPKCGAAIEITEKIMYFWERTFICWFSCPHCGAREVPLFNPHVCIQVGAE